MSHLTCELSELWLWHPQLSAVTETAWWYWHLSQCCGNRVHSHGLQWPTVMLLWWKGVLCWAQTMLSCFKATDPDAKLWWHKTVVSTLAAVNSDAIAAMDNGVRFWSDKHGQCSVDNNAQFHLQQQALQQSNQVFCVMLLFAELHVSQWWQPTDTWEWKQWQIPHNDSQW